MAISVQVGGRAVPSATVAVRELGFGHVADFAERSLLVCLIEFDLADVAAVLTRGFTELQDDARTGQPPIADWERVLRESENWEALAQAEDSTALTGFLEFMALELLNDLACRGLIGGAPGSVVRHVCCAFLSPMIVRSASRVRINGVAAAIA